MNNFNLTEYFSSFSNFSGWMWYIVDECIYWYLCWKDMVFPLPPLNDTPQLTNVVIHYNNNVKYNTNDTNVIQNVLIDFNNPDKINDYKFLEIIYKYKNNKYRVICKSGNNITFKNGHIYLNFINNNASNNECQSISYTKDILMAEHNNEDITTLIKELAGPDVDFHRTHGKDIHFTVNDLTHLLGKNKHIHENENENECEREHELIITDCMGNDHIFKNDDQIIIHH